jgi:hypothetical protein
MTDESGTNADDEPARGATDNSPDADRDVLVAYRVPEGIVNLEDVTDEHRA